MLLPSQICVSKAWEREGSGECQNRPRYSSSSKEDSIENLAMKKKIIIEEDSSHPRSKSLEFDFLQPFIDIRRVEPSTTVWMSIHSPEIHTVNC